MRVNEDTILCGRRVVLVPYRREHVETYHEWMKSPELLELTASEPLTREEEYEMQLVRRLKDQENGTKMTTASHCTLISPCQADAQELTFILLARPDGLPWDDQPVIPPSHLPQCRMVGDVNMFLPDGLTGDAECEIMIASPSDRRKGFAREALQIFLTYATQTLRVKPEQLIARIGQKNTPSIALFQKLGFEVEKVVEVFEEVQLRCSHSPPLPGADGESAWYPIPLQSGPYDSKS